MARETRIGMALMMLLFGAFGFMAYQRWNSDQPTLLAAADEVRDQLERVESADHSTESDEPTSNDSVPAEASLGEETPPTTLADAPPSPFAEPAGPPPEPATLAAAPEPISNPFAGGETETAVPMRPVPTPAGDPFGEMAGEEAPPSELIESVPAEPTPADSLPVASDPFSTASTPTVVPPNQPVPEQPDVAPPPADTLPFTGMASAAENPLPGGPAAPEPGLGVAEAEPLESAPKPDALNESEATEPVEVAESPFGAAPMDSTLAPPETIEADPAAVTLSEDPFTGLEEPAPAGSSTTEPPADPEALADAAAAPVTLEDDPFATNPAPESAPAPETALAESPFAESVPLPAAEMEPPEAASDAPPFGEAPPPSPETTPLGSEPEGSPFGEVPATNPEALTTPGGSPPILDPENAGPPAPAGAPPEADPEPTRPHIVQENDNYWSISKQAYGSPIYAHALAQYNAAEIPDPRDLRPGMRVPIPPLEVLKDRYAALIATGSRAVERSQPRSGFFMTETGEPAYRVGESETLEEIAQSHLGRSSRSMQILEMNREVIKDPKSLQPGTILKLPIDASRVKLVPRGDVEG